MKHCIDCKYDVRNEKGIMIGCEHPTMALRCAFIGARSGVRPWFEPKERTVSGNSPDAIQFLKEGTEDAD